MDIGRTFTDVVLITDIGQVKIAKGLSTPGAFDRGISDILDDLLRDEAIEPAACSAFVHGTTVATNAIIERTGARTGLITTKGFRDVLGLRRIRIPSSTISPGRSRRRWSSATAILILTDFYGGCDGG